MRKKQKAFSKLPANPYRLFPECIFDDNLGRISRPENIDTLAELEMYGLKRKKVVEIIRDTFEPGVIHIELLKVVGGDPDRIKQGEKIFKCMGKAIVELEKIEPDLYPIIKDFRGAKIGDQIGENTIATVIDRLKREQKRWANLFNVHPEIWYLSKPFPKSIKQMFSFQAVRLSQYMFACVESYYEGGPHDFRKKCLYELLSELFKKIYVKFPKKLFTPSKMKELCDTHNLDAKSKKVIERMSKGTIT